MQNVSLRISRHNSTGSSLCSEQELQIIAELIYNRKKIFLTYVTSFFRQKKKKDLLL